MARIFIDVHPDGTFTTGTYHGDPVAHAANQPAGVTTYMTEDVGEVDGFAECYSRHTNGCGHFVRGAYLVGSWRVWGAFCINKWGGWFERVDGSIRRARLPTPHQKIDERVVAALHNNGELGIGVIKNRLRKLRPSEIFDSLARLQRSGLIAEERFRHPTNGLESARYRLI